MFILSDVVLTVFEFSIEVYCLLFLFICHTGQFWSAGIASEVYEGDRTGLVPGYDAFTLTVTHPQSSVSRKFVGVLIPRLWNHETGQCIYAGDSRGGSTGTGPFAPFDSVIQGKYHDYRMKGLFTVDFPYSNFDANMCN